MKFIVQYLTETRNGLEDRETVISANSAAEAMAKVGKPNRHVHYAEPVTEGE